LLLSGLESVKKTNQVAPENAGAVAPPVTPTDPDTSLSIAQGLKRLGLPLAAILSIALIGLAGMSVLLDRGALRQAVEAQIKAVTGLDLVVKGAIDVSVFPQSRVVFHDVGLKDGGAGEAALRVDVLTANLRLLPLLLQRFEIADLVLQRPDIHIVREADGRSNWTPFIRAVTQNVKPGAANPLSFSEIRIEDGILTYRDDAHHRLERADDIDISLAWPSISRSFAATGQFDWRGERVDGSISIADFIASLTGETSGLKVRAAAPSLKFAFDGTVANKTSLMMEGTVTADSGSLRDALFWIGETPPGGGGFGRFALKARANVVGPSVALTNLNIELDGNVAEGVLTYSNNGRQNIQATLAAGALDFTPYVSTFRLLASGAHDWNRQLFDLTALSGADVDMRLSAAKVTVGSSRLGHTALGANLRDGTLALSVGEAQMFGGTAKGSFNIARADANADVKAQFQLIDVDLQSCASELFGITRLSGRGTINVAIQAEGSSPFGLAQSLDGTATLTGYDGAISGFNVEQLLKRLERRPLSGGGHFRSGQTPFNTMKMSFHFNDGIATADSVQIDGPTTRVTLTGTASVPRREYDLKGTASLTAASAEETSFDLPFVVQGPWDDPLIFPDPVSLIRRSPASAPLLEAVKDRRTRDAVRSVLERITGKKVPEAAIETPASAPGAQKRN
jgi:AsmA protein